MIDHPITPPPELVQQWASEFYGTTIAPGEAAIHIAAQAARWGAAIHIATQAARWGSDQELEACLDELYKGVGLRIIDHGSHRELLCSDLRAARRPKPPSLKEQALAVIENSEICNHLSPEHAAILRRALEALDD